MRRFEQYTDRMPKLFPEEFPVQENGSKRLLARTVTFQVTDACNLACSYCYQINKGVKVMPWDVAKKAVDMILGADEKNEYLNPQISPAIILEFIGGEPLLQVDLIDRILDYFMIEAAYRDHPWATRFMASISSNGTLYFEPGVQRFLEKHKQHLSFSISIDGNKDLHDSCRKFPDGRGSYDIAVAAARDWMGRGGTMGSKITLAPANVGYAYDAITHMVELGYNEINANTVYEKGWTAGHAREFYRQLKKIADYWNDRDLVETHFLSLFDDRFFRPMDPQTENDNWCGGTGYMLAVDPDGRLYPCLRYMPSSLGTKVKPLIIGDVRRGIGCTGKCRDCIKALNAITRRSQSTDECFSCPIASGCAWCSAYNYQETGSPDRRVTYICGMHKARSLANAYFWNIYFIRHRVPKFFHIYCPDEWALEVVAPEELARLKRLEADAKDQKRFQEVSQ